MRKSAERILTTHVGSLIRPEPLLPLIRAKQSGQPYDEPVYRERLALSVKEVVQRQADAGIDVPSDGEFGKSISWSQYALERLSGFERRPVRGLGTIAQGADRKRIDAVRLDAGRMRFENVRFQGSRPSFGHLAAAGIAGAEEQDLGLVARVGQHGCTMTNVEIRMKKE